MDEEDLRRLTLRWASQCARREYCTGEIRTRLERQGIPAPQIDVIMEELIRRRFVDDVRYTNAFVRTKLKEGWGLRKIIYALRTKQIPSPMISEAVSANTDTDAYLAIALKAGRIKARRLDMTLPSDRAKLQRFLASRGYEYSIISRVTNTLRSERT